MERAAVKDEAIAQGVFERAWSARAPHLHGLSFWISPSNPDVFRIDVETDTRDGHLVHLGYGHIHVRESHRHRKPGRIAVDHMHPHAWGLHAKHLYYEAGDSAEHVERLISAGVGLLPDMARHEPKHAHHAAIDRNDIPTIVSDWRCVWARRVESEKP